MTYFCNEKSKNQPNAMLRVCTCTCLSDILATDLTIAGCPLYLGHCFHLRKESNETTNYFVKSSPGYIMESKISPMIGTYRVAHLVVEGTWKNYLLQPRVLSITSSILSCQHSRAHTSDSTGTQFMTAIYQYIRCSFFESGRLLFHGSTNIDLP